MKKLKTIICLLLIVFLIVIIFVGKKCLDNRKSNNVKTNVKIDIPKENISYMEIRKRSHNYIIKNPEKIMEIIQYINNEPLMSAKQESKYSSNRYNICIYSDNEILTDIQISDERLFYKKAYDIVNTGELMKKIEDILSYCKISLPEIGYRINRFETSGIELSQEKAINEYNSLVNAMPIRENEFKTSDTYYFIRTFNDEDIYVYYVGDEKYIKCIKSYSRNISEDSENIPKEILKDDDVVFFKICK